MIHFRLAIEKPICYTYHWIVIPVRVGINVATKVVRNVHLLLMLNV